MADIVKSGIYGTILMGTLIFSAPILNEDKDEEIVTSSENKLEQKTEKDIHIPL